MDEKKIDQIFETLKDTLKDTRKTLKELKEDMVKIVCVSGTCKNNNIKKGSFSCNLKGIEIGLDERRATNCSENKFHECSSYCARIEAK